MNAWLFDAILYLVYYWQVANKTCTVKLDNLYTGIFLDLLRIYTVRWKGYTRTIKLLQGGYIADLKTSHVYINVNPFLNNKHSN